MIHMNINSQQHTILFRIIVLITAIFLSLPTAGVGPSKKQSEVHFLNPATAPLIAIGLINLIGNPLYYTFYKENKLPNVPQVVYDFYRDIVNPPKGTKFHVKAKDSTVKLSASVAIDTPSIFVLVAKGGISDLERLHASLTCQHKNKISVRCSCPESSEIQKELDAYRFIAHHEAIHAKERHMTMFGLACLGVPTITHMVGKLLQINKANEINTLIRFIINALLLSRYRRYNEQRADDGTPNIKEILDGGIHTFTNAQAIMAKLRGTVDSTNHNPLHFVAELFASHPSFLQRIAALQKRIDTLGN